MPARHFHAIVVALAVLAVSLSLLLYLSRSLALSRGPPVIIGIGTHGNLSSEDVALSSGVRYFRNDITLEPQQVSQIMNESSQYGARYLGILDYATLGGISVKGWNTTVWNRTVAKAVADYPEIATWEVWNQPWFGPFQTGLVNGSAYNYYRVTRDAYLQIKKAEPNSTVVCFGGAPIADYGTLLWYEQAWGYGMARYCDAISLHAYPSLPFNQSEQKTWSTYLSAYENLTGKPIWITETGLPVIAGTQLTQDAQSAFMREGIAFFSSFVYIKRVYWFDLWEGSKQYDYGLLNDTDPTGTAKAAWKVFTSLYYGSASSPK